MSSTRQIVKFKDLDVGERFWYKESDKEGWATKIKPSINPDFDNFTRWNAVFYDTNTYISIQKYSDVEKEP